MLFRKRHEPKSHLLSSNDAVYTAAAIIAISLLLIGCAFIRSQYPYEPTAVLAPEPLSNGMPLP